MYNIGICDDGKNICYDIEKALRNWADENEKEISTAVWYSGEELKEYLTQNNCPDVLFLDIELNETTGIDVGDYIRNYLDNAAAQIIYISYKSSYAMQLFRTQPFDFLVKPIKEEDIYDVMDRALKQLERKRMRLDFQFGKEYFSVPMGDILYIFSSGRKLSVITNKKNYEFYGKLKDIKDKLSSDFISIHKSYEVNRYYIRKFTYEMVELENGDVLTISPSKRKNVRELFLRDE